MRHAFKEFERLAKKIEETNPSYAHVYRGSNGLISISMGIPKDDLLEPILKMH